MSTYSTNPLHILKKFSKSKNSLKENYPMPSDLTQSSFPLSHSGLRLSMSLFQPSRSRSPSRLQGQGRKELHQVLSPRTCASTSARRQLRSSKRISTRRRCCKSARRMESTNPHSLGTSSKRRRTSPVQRPCSSTSSKKTHSVRPSGNS